MKLRDAVSALLILSVQGFCGTPTASAWFSTRTKDLRRKCLGPISAYKSPSVRESDLNIFARRRDHEPTSFHNIPEAFDGTWRAIRSWTGSCLIFLMISCHNPLMSLAENELAEFADGKFNSDLVSSECFATSCKAPTKACFEDNDCKKGATPPIKRNNNMKLRRIDDYASMTQMRCMTSRLLGFQGSCAQRVVLVTARVSLGASLASVTIF